MASHISVGSASSSGAHTRSRSRTSTYGELLCFHDEVAPLRVVRVEGPTKGKRFYGCSHWPKTCGFFKWANIPDNVNELQHRVFERDVTIAELELEVDLLRAKVEKLKEKKEKLVDEVEEMGIATTETMYMLKERKGEKKLMMALVLSWVLFALVFLFL